jgi:hypothetical protein
MQKHAINENHKRAIGVALAALDEALCMVEAWAGGREAVGVLYSETNDLPPHRRAALRKHVEDTRRLLVEAREHLGLPMSHVRASNDIWGRCCVLRDMLAELDSARLKGYGKLSAGAGEYVDGLSERLLAAVNRIADAARSEPRAEDG